MRICDPLIYAEDAKKYQPCQRQIPITDICIWYSPWERRRFDGGGGGGGGGSYVNFLGI